MLTKTLEEIKSIFPQFVSNVSEDTALPNMEQAEYKYLVPLIGLPLYNDLNDRYNANPQTLTSEDLPLLSKCRMVSVSYAYSDDLALSHITLTDNGARKFSPNNTESVSKWEYEKLQSTLINKAHDGTEVLLNYLFEKLPVLWLAGASYENITKLLIRTGSEFSNLYTLQQAQRTFWSIRSCITDSQELYLYEGIGEDLFSYFLQLATPTDKEAKILHKLKKATALFSIALACTRYAVRFSDQGFTVLQAIMDNNHANSGQIAAGGDLINLKQKAVEATAQEILQMARYDLYTWYQDAASSTSFKQAYQSGPMARYKTPADRNKKNGTRKGIFRM